MKRGKKKLKNDWTFFKAIYMYMGYTSPTLSEPCSHDHGFWNYIYHIDYFGLTRNIIVILNIDYFGLTRNIIVIYWLKI
jgi:hypothetical protein